MVLIIGYTVVLLALFLKTCITDLNKGTRFFDKTTISAAAKLNILTQNNQEVYIFNAWDNLYPLSNTYPAIKPWYPYLSWYMDLPGVQESIVSNLQKNKPFWIVTTTDNEGLSAYRPELIYSYIESNYTEAFRQDNYLFLLRIK